MTARKHPRYCAYCAKREVSYEMSTTNDDPPISALICDVCAGRVRGWYHVVMRRLPERRESPENVVCSDCNHPLHLGDLQVRVLDELLCADCATEKGILEVRQ